MGWVLTTLLLLSPAVRAASTWGVSPGPPALVPTPGLNVASAVGQASEDEVLPSRDLQLPPVIVQNIDPVSFDLLDARADVRDEKKVIRNEDPHSMFVIKRHVGASVGYDNSLLHGGVGFYVTVAEWGRWNFGIPSLGAGWTRYPTYDKTQGLVTLKNQPTIFVSIASVHYRISYLQSLGMNWYLNLEQIYDLRYNMTGSQFGISLSNK
jgi:hypothetical protein